MSLSSPPREEIAQLTARLRSEHDEYESASQSWSPEAEEKKRELRKARADTWVEIEAALTCLGEVERLQEIERLPFEQKLARLEAFLAEPFPPAPPARGHPGGASSRAEAGRHRRRLGRRGSGARTRNAWPDSGGARGAHRPGRRTQGEAPREGGREGRTSQGARCHREGQAKAKSRRLRNEPEPRRPSQSQVEEPVANESPREGGTPRVPSRRNDPRVLALLVAIVLVAGGVVLFLATRV